MSRRESRPTEERQIADQGLKTCVDKLEKARNDMKRLLATMETEARKRKKIDRQFQMVTEAWNDFVRQTANLEREHRASKEESEKRKELHKKFVEVSAQQQRSLGEQLHDSLAQQLYAMRMMVGNLFQKARKGAKIHPYEIRQLSVHLRTAESEARSLARGLVPIELQGAYGLVAALERLVHQVCELWKPVHCWVESDDSMTLEDDFTAVKLYYIAREALNNALRHGEPTRIVVRLRAGRKEETVLEVEDDGVGIGETDLEKSGGLGLQIMRHRADLVGARLEIKRREEGGTLVRCILGGE